MRKLDWIAAAVIGVFLAGAAIHATAWAVSSLADLGHGASGGSGQNLVVRAVSISADWPIARLGPTIFHRP